MFLNCFAFIFGAAVGSFLNVCIFRIPENTSIIKPGSRCPHCLMPLRFYDNIPIISFIFCAVNAGIAAEKFPGVILWWNFLQLFSH